jgi:hypothetical protein
MSLPLVLPSGLYTLRASPAPGVGGLYATGNGINHIVTVAAEKPPFVEHQVVSILCLNAFRMAKPTDVLLRILYSGTFKPSMARQAYTPSLSTPAEEPFGGHWYPKGGQPVSKDPIITSDKSYEWYIAYKHTPGVISDTITYVYMIYNILSQRASPHILQHSGTYTAHRRGVVRWN